MSENLRFVTRNCLEWITDCPFVDYPKQSPILSFSNIDCYLSLHIKYLFTPGFKSTNGYTFYLYLHKEEMEEKHLKEDIRITFYVTKHNSNGLFLKRHIDIDLQCKENTAISEFIGSSMDSLHKYYGRLTVLCIFPSELYINRNEASQVQSDLLDSSYIIRKAKLDAIASYDSISDEENLSTDFRKLMEQQSTSDVTVTCGNRSFSAHSIILAARSEVFAAMFENKMIESETGSIDIKDIDGEVFELLLKYVYTGKIPELSVDIASSLFIAADKYSIHSLKKKCSKWMLGNVTKENCLEFLFVADTWNDAKLKDRLVNFVGEILLLLEGDEWQKFSDKYPKLANTVYQKRVKRFKTV